MSGIRQQPQAPTVLRQLAGGERIDLHVHDDHQIVYAAAGVVSVATKQGTWVGPATRAIWIPARTPHEHRAYGDTALHLVGLPVNPLGLATPAVLSVHPLLRELIIAYTDDPADDSAERRRLRAVLLDQLKLSTQQAALRLPAAQDTRLAALCAILDRTPADSRPLAALGSAVGASERTLSRLFRAEFAMTFPQWRTQLRLHHALVLLAEGHPVTTVAHLCGWSTPSAFIDTYKQTFTTTPGRHHP
ncbi:helix-turn-helix transcriptional regulator [Kribbella qitaiheensis]|uniref:HTH-type transcriptional regulator RipA n=1 Tax=Kribbella qitaiheensis TaxID=1544730 RepID=A0A7G6X3C2_9ACTN|nr:helix-turn-helix transcriptional regulator [Kribbella qitaiheensis]QNE20737.1 helix-turn-helix transcriptional regulator [Kribbella qitaiheensis]